MYVAKDLRQPEPRKAAAAHLAEVLRRFPAGPPTLDPEEDLGAGDRCRPCPGAPLPPSPHIKARRPATGVVEGVGGEGGE